jgi:PTH1 family peptidyl-tRNA hydrolase
MKLIVGLGNPGREYVGSRHNVGWEALDALARRLGWISSAGDFERLGRSRFDGIEMDGTVSLSGGASEKLMLLKPLTYMNLSGRSLKAAASFHQIAVGDMLVVLDDLALPTGRIRLRPGGSSGGHNGLKDIERALGTMEYPRLRIGIDAPPPRVPQKDYVLGRFSAEQRASLEPAIDRSIEAMLAWIEKGMEAAMNVFNAA